MFTFGFVQVSCTSEYFSSVSWYLKAKLGVWDPDVLDGRDMCLHSLQATFANCSDDPSHGSLRKPPLSLPLTAALQDWQGV